MAVEFKCTTTALGIATLLLAQQLHAGGFYISEIGTPASLGTAGAANTTNTVGPDSSWTNPAGMTGLQSDELMAGLQVVVAKVEFDPSIAEAGGDDGGNAGNNAAIPSFFYVKKVSERSRLGFSVAAPMGGGINYGDGFAGRYGATKAVLSGIGFSPSYAYKVNDQLSLGAGVSVIYTRFDESIAINFPDVGPVSVPDGKVKMENLTDWGYQPFLGMTWEFSDQLLVGVVYRAEMDVDLEGDLNFRNMPGGFSPPADDLDVGWDNPQLLAVGIRYRIRDDLTLVANADWEDWSVFSKNRLEVSGGTLNPDVTLDRNWKDTWHLAVGLVHRMGTQLISAGISYDSSVVDDEDRTIDLPLDQVLKLSVGYGWKGSKQMDFALGATLMWLGDGEVDQTAQGVRFKGEFDRNYAAFLGGTLRYRF